jgi:predicted secreted protein
MARRAILVITVFVVLFASAASGVTLTVITERDSGKTFGVRNGGKLTLRLSERYRWTGPRVNGTAIRLVPVNYVRDPGFHEWTIRAKALGLARITAVGYSAEGGGGCDPGPCAPRLFRVAVRVR